MAVFVSSHHNKIMPSTKSLINLTNAYTSSLGSYSESGRRQNAWNAAVRIFSANCACSNKLS